MRESSRLSAGPDLSGLYVHIPFCKRKCPYCAFYSREPLPGEMHSFAKAAGIEIEKLRGVQDIRTVYIGGGTPTVLDESSLTYLLESLQSIIKDADEITCEANPDSITRKKLKILKQFGVNRLSIGVQSFRDENLKLLGRLNDAEMSISALSAARDAGFGNISIDLMYGLPKQSIGEWRDDLYKAIEIGPEHISFYGLTVDDGTPFEHRYGAGKGGAELPSDDECREMYYSGIDILKDAGYVHYEISNFARHGCESKHNLNYWRHGEYFAVGPSAAGFDAKRRFTNVPDIGEYISRVTSGGNLVDEYEELSKEQRISEEMMLGLRLTDGVDISVLEGKCDICFDEIYGGIVIGLIASGMLERDGNIVRLSRDGLFVSDAVMSEFMLV